MKFPFRTVQAVLQVAKFDTDFIHTHTHVSSGRTRHGADYQCNLFLLGTELESLQLTASKFALTARDAHESLDCLFWPEPFLSARLAAQNS